MAILRMRFLFLISLITGASADLRFASWAKDSYKLRQDNNGNNGNQLFVNDGPGGQNSGQSGNDVFFKYMEPSTFEYQGLSGGGGQKRNNYDQFLRSNIDNEQDNRNFNVDEGEDHMPFRTRATTVQMQENAVDLTAELTPGKEQLVPLRWNNPHSAEIEVNIHIMRCTEAEKPECKPVAVPLAKPCCGGEGYQNNVIRFAVPTDFNQLGAKIPGFKGCVPGSTTTCVLQVYAHSVESRMYSYGFPVYVKDTPTQTAATFPAATATSDTQIRDENYCADPGMQLNTLDNPICISCLDAAKIDKKTSEPQYSKLASDVYNHAFQNSDFSPYSGQQHCAISRNLQASAINKMVTGNRGELGKNAIPQAMKTKINQLSNAEDRIYKKYEALANNLINRYGRQMKEDGVLKAGQTTQPLSNVFRSRQVASTKSNRQQTNTYIPSFQLNADLIAQAKERIPTKYQGLLTETGPDAGLVQIYVAATNDLTPLFENAAKEEGILYQPNMFKSTFMTMRSATQFKKRNAAGQTDGGKYAGQTATVERIAGLTNGGCTEQCLNAGAGAGKPPLLRDSAGTSITGQCAPCAQMFSNAPLQAPPTPAPAPTPIGSDLIANPVADLPPTPDVDPVQEYPDTDGTARVGRPPTPSTTTQKIWYSPGPWMSSGGGGGGVGVVGGSTRAGWDVLLLGFMVLVVTMGC
jgi:hypothetical protein